MAGMDCSRAQSMIEPFLNDILSDADKTSFINHIKNCASCREELSIYHVVYAVVDQLDNGDESEIMDYEKALEQKLVRSEDGVRLRRSIKLGIILFLILVAGGIVAALLLMK